MRISRLHHIQITLPPGREDEARRFYCGLLGLREIAKPESLRARGGRWLEVGGQQIHLGVEDGIDRAATKSHVAYQVTDIARWRRRLEDAGVAIGPSVPIPGYERFELRDPFGNRVELIEPITAPSEV